MPLQTFFVVFKIVFPFTLGFILVLQFLGIAKNEMRNRFAQIRSNNNSRGKSIFFFYCRHILLFTHVLFPKKSISIYIINNFFFILGVDELETFAVLFLNSHRNNTRAAGTISFLRRFIFRKTLSNLLYHSRTAIGTSITEKERRVINE